MDLEKRLAISYYKTIATINEEHEIYLTQHTETGEVCIKKTLDVYNLSVYSYLYNNPIANTPRIIEFCEDEGRLIVIEEYITGTTLLELINKKELDFELIKTIITKLCYILNELHNAEPAIIHRDVKPSNIIISADRTRVTLLDFDAAKKFKPSEDEDTRLLGTKGYAAPEQYGFGSSSPQTDIYALGVLLKEMCSVANVELSNFESIIDKCTRLEPKDRYASVYALSKDIFQVTEMPRTFKLTHPNRFPGFRGDSVIIKLGAGALYILLIIGILNLKSDKIEPDKIIFYKIWGALFILTAITLLGNFRGIASKLPLCSSDNKPAVRIIARILWTCLILFVLSLILAFIV